MQKYSSIFSCEWFYYPSGVKIMFIYYPTDRRITNQISASTATTDTLNGLTNT